MVRRANWPCNVSCATAKKLAELLGDDTVALQRTLEELRISSLVYSRAVVGAEGAAALAAVLHRTSLRKIVVGPRASVIPLHGADTLFALNLPAQRLGAAELAILAAAIPIVLPLHDVDLSNNLLRPHFAPLCAALGPARLSSELHLANTGLGPAGDRRSSSATLTLARPRWPACPLRRAYLSSQPRQQSSIARIQYSTASKFSTLVNSLAVLC